MIKKILVAIIVLIILSGIGFLIWFFVFFNPDASNNPDKVNLFPLPQIDTSGGGSQNNGKEVSFIIEGENTNGEEGKPPLVRKISTGPISGYTTFIKEVEVIETGDASSTPKTTLVDEVFIRYIDRETGNLIEAKEKELGLERLSNTTILKIQEAILNNNGESTLLRYLNSRNNVQTLSAKLTEKEVEETDILYELKGDFLQQDILSVTTNPNKDEVFLLLEGTNGGSLGYLSKYNGTDQKLIFTSPLRDWNIDWPSDSTITLTSKPNSTEPGIAFSLNTQSGKVSKLLDTINGLTVNMSPSSSHLLYSESVSTGINMFVKDTKNNSVKQLEIQTLPEKCVWSNINETTLYCAVPNSILQSSFPESWYIGSLFFNDSLWKIDVDLLSYTLLMSDRERVERSFDMHEMTLTDEDEFLYFRNKQDLELWSINIKEF